MTSYIPAFIARRFSRSNTDPEVPVRLHASSQPAISSHEPSNQEVESRSRRQNEALDRVLAGDEDEDVLSPMSIGTPSEGIENDLRRLDRNRLAQASNIGPAATDHTRTRGTTDPLPRPARGSWQARTRNSALSEAIQNTANPRMGAAGYVDDPAQSRSVRASVSSNMSMSPTTPGTPVQELKGPPMLPEDDGMSDMRGKIQAVQALNITPAEKSRLVHILMTERYTASSGKSPSHRDILQNHREILRDAALDRSISPAGASFRSARSQDPPLTPKSDQSGLMDGLLGPNGDALASPSTSVFTTHSEAKCAFSPDDLKPTYYSKEPVNQHRSSNDTRNQSRQSESMGDEDLVPEDDDQQPLGCAHYVRNVKLQCHACLKWYTCRFCHDEVEDHNLERRRTRNMLCMICGTTQPAAQDCRSCGEEAATYYCDVCKLWDNDPTKSIYHCDDCGICRVGQGLGKDFFHCKVCDVCISMSIRDTHKCIERSVDCDCPICGEYMFTSPQTVVFMRCGHSIHHTCYKQHLETSFKCPICAKSIMNMEMTFRQLDRAIAAQPMPEGFQDTSALVVCNDCRSKSRVPYHWLGLKCGECDSYNTAQLQIIGPNDRVDPDLVETDRVDTDREGRQTDPMSGHATPGLQSGVQTGYHTPRGRSESGNLLVHDRARRPTSTSAIQELRVPLGTNYFYPISNTNRSVSAMGTDRVRPGWGTNSTAVEPMDVDDDELDFWGNDHSPRLRQATMSGQLPAGHNRAEESDQEESDSDDDIMHDPDDDFDDDDDDEDGLMDELDIFGHR